MTPLIFILHQNAVDTSVPLPALLIVTSLFLDVLYLVVQEFFEEASHAVPCK